LPLQSVMPATAGKRLATAASRTGKLAVGKGPTAAGARVEAERVERERAQAALDGLAAHTVALRAAQGAALTECFASVPDPRDPRGIRHRLPVVLILCVAAVLSGESSVVAVAEWAGHAPQELLAAVGARRDRLLPGRYVAPSAPSVVRLLAALTAKVLARQVGAWLAGRDRAEGPARAARRATAKAQAGSGSRPAVAVDGKALRGARGADGQVPYLLAAATLWGARSRLGP